MKTAYFDCFSGISGDMTLGALVALGVPLDFLKEQISRLPLSGFSIVSQDVMDNGIAATRVTVNGDQSHPRNYRQIRDLIENSPLTAAVKANSLDIFERIAVAESTIHGCAKEKVHFHEVGGIDAIVDIVGSCLGIHYLGIERIEASTLPLGKGWVTCQHGTLPVPAPATLEILKRLPVHSGQQACELVTPTGAAIIANLAAQFGPMPAMSIDKIGYGAGTRVLEGQPNLLRILLGRAIDQSGGVEAAETLTMVETAIDDMIPEFFGYLMERLFKAGALDVLYIPAMMKKNRPGTLVQVLCAPQERETVAGIILEETTSLGVRFYEVRRSTLPRRAVMVRTEFGVLKTKAVTGPDGRQRIVPEYEVCRQVAQARGISLRSVYESILRSAEAVDDH